MKKEEIDDDLLRVLKQIGIGLTRTELLEKVKENRFALEYADEEFKSDKEVVLTAVKKDGFALNYASDNLKNDREVVLEAIKENGHALECASEELRSDKEILYAIKDFLEKNQEEFVVEYEMLKKYEREDKLKEKMGFKNSRIKKVKI